MAPDNDDILNNNISDERKIKAMEQATKIMNKSKTNIHLLSNSNSKDSWLVAIIESIITTSDKVIRPHKYKFENTREAAN